jgi:restriction system protein
VALLRGLRYTAVQRTGKAGDLGTDITCLDPQGRTAIVQCKRYAPGNTIGTPVVQTFIGMMTVHHRADRGLIVATVPFTQQAVDLARHHGVALIDGPALLLLLHLTAIPLHQQSTP